MSTTVAKGDTQDTPAARPVAPRRPKTGRGRDSIWKALPWIAPCLVLVVGIVLFPAGYMIYNAFRSISSYGTDTGSAGLTNFTLVFADPALPRVLANTVVWVAAVVIITVVLSLALAQFLNKPFPGRTLVRMAVIVPWAASVVMTTTVFVYGLDPFYGIINKFMVDLHLIDAPFGFTKSMPSAFIVAILTAVFVSMPFTSYTILAGLQGVPGEVLEAAKMDGASPARTYFSVILPQLRDSLAVAVLINIINVFNNLAILKIITGSLPGYDADTLITRMFKWIQVDQRVDVASAMSVVNFAIVLVIVAAYIKIVKPMKEVD
ncbi:multiple sugar transport system permease protein [Arthrobacter sp. ov407]|uniref:carbohydrate ABC transporter permease n=1 Tax=Arthrobacter sp. ov407 TaxID=1761748 RepID=UPI0008833265|nr:sugar ABC transporter permease [Arthrobacter sp. ov407]SDL18844.1 multiple sugar transport system permease protein [Arthrobacter sp. ov407]